MCIVGNDLRFTREQSRRAIMINLNANVPRAWTRTGFKHELPQWALDNRAMLIRACVILVNNWIARGRPKGAKSLGSYESWSYVVGGILTAAGIEGFLGNQNKRPEEETDRNEQRWTLFIEAWWNTYITKQVTAKDLITLAGEIIPDDGKSERSHVTRLGSLLMRWVNATFEIGTYPEGYLKIVRAEVEREKGGAHDGYSLTPISKSCESCFEVGEVGGDPETVQKPKETKRNSTANLIADGAEILQEVGGEKHQQNQGEFSEKAPSANLANLEKGFLIPEGNSGVARIDESSIATNAKWPDGTISDSAAELGRVRPLSPSSDRERL
jgi:hypothetical protein